MQLKRSINVRKNSFICQENVISFGRKLNNGLDRMEKMVSNNTTQLCQFTENSVE